MNDLKSILQKILKSSPAYDAHAAKLEVFEAWPKIVGDRVARHAWPQRLLDGDLLLVAAESSAWLQSLRYLEPQILEKYAALVKTHRVAGLRFKLDTRRPESF